MAKTRPEKQVQFQVEACDKKNEELKKENQGYLAPPPTPSGWEYLLIYKKTHKKVGNKKRENLGFA
jgi:hypothetical protein